MKFKNSLKNIIYGPTLTLKKFPITILFSTLLAIVLIIISETKPVEDTLSKFAMVIALGIPLSLCIKLFFHRKEKGSPFKLIIYYAFGAVLLALYYFFLLPEFKMVPITRYIGVSLALYLGFLFVPYLFNKEGFELYVIKVFTGFFITVIYSLVLYGGLSAILFTIDKLLGITVQGKVYYYTWLLVACIFAPSYFLADIPLIHTPIDRNYYPKLIRILLLYIVMPLLSIYTIILYIYFGKILLTRQWPVGIVSHLVLWYSVIVAAVIFLINPIRLENSWANRFQNLLPKIILPIMVMMFISIGIRVKEYGVTERRYYVIVLGMWVLGIMLYYSIIKVRKTIILPLTLSLVALVSVFGPLSSYSISKLSQNNRLKALLIRNNMLTDGKITAASATVSKEDRLQISSVLNYFDSNHSLKEVRYLPSEFKYSDMEKVFGFTHESPDPYVHNAYFYFTGNQVGGALNIQGYDYIFDMRELYKKSNSKTDTLNATYNQDTGILKIAYQGNEFYSKDLNLFALKLIEKHGILNGENLIPRDDMIFVEENEKIKVKFIFSSISGERNPTSDRINVNGVDFYVLVKIK